MKKGVWYFTFVNSAVARWVLGGEHPQKYFLALTTPWYIVLARALFVNNATILPDNRGRPSTAVIYIRTLTFWITIEIPLFPKKN